MRRIVIFTYLILFHFLCFSQKDLKFFLKKGDSLRAVKAYPLSYAFYDSASAIALPTDIISYARALIGKGYALRFDRKNPDYEGAYQFFFQALSLTRDNDSIPDKINHDLYYGLAVSERVRLNYDVAMEYGDLALIAAKQMNDPMAVSRCYNMLANIHATKGNIDTGIENIKSAINIRKSIGQGDDSDIAHWYLNLGIMSSWKGSTNQSNSYFKKALAMFDRMGTNELSTTNEILQEIAKNYADLDRIDSARVYYQRALGRAKRQPQKGRLLSHHYDLIGKMHLKLSERDSALYFFQESIIAGVTDFAPTSILENPMVPKTDIDSWLLNPNLYVVLDEKAKTLLDLYLENDSIEYLISSYELYEAVASLLVDLRSELDNDDRLLHLASHAKPIFDNALEVASLLLTEEGTSPELMASAFNYIEQIKHTILLKYRSNDFEIGEELELASEIRIVQREIDELRYRISTTKVEKTIGYLGIEELIQKVISLRDEKGLLAGQEKELDSNEFLIKSIDEVKQYLNPHQVLLSYFWGSEYMYGIAVTKKGTVFRKTPLVELEDHIDSFLATTSNLNFDNSEVDFKSFNESAFSIYNVLLKPFFEELRKQGIEGIHDLIVIPDGKINMMPFGSLVTQVAKSEVIDYKNLSYLIRDYEINYGFSSSNLMIGKGIDSKTNRLVGFSSTALQGTQEELDNISSLWSGEMKRFDGSHSTETNFKTNAVNFDIIHVASHASSGDLRNQPNINFFVDSTSREDGKLFSYEIYPLNLSNRLTVLSACETGLGEIHEGEGVFSLARGFAFAGSASIVTSLWKVRDRQTTELMTSFYQHLEEGLTVKNSLRTSKLDYLKNSDEISSHPSFWSSFIIIGSGDKEIIVTRITISRILWIAVPILFVLLLLYRFKTTKGSSASVHERSTG